MSTLTSPRLQTDEIVGPDGVAKKEISVQHLLDIARVKAKILAEEEAKRFENYEMQVTTKFDEVKKENKVGTL